MGVGDYLRRAFRRKKSSKGQEPASGAPVVAPPLIIHHGIESSSSDEADVKTITKIEMQQAIDNQDTCVLFAKLPLEIRRQIYRAVWESYLRTCHMSPSTPGSSLRLHIYTDGSRPNSLSHSQCVVPAGPRDDTDVTDPWPFDAHSAPALMPPKWFWYACVMRLHWGKHGPCQHAHMRRWNPLTGSVTPAEKSPFLPLFLTCKKIYLEAIVSFFETVMLIFTSSEDAIRFFVQKPHPFLDHLRFLEFGFANRNDHLFLGRIRRSGVPGENPPGNMLVAADGGVVYGQKLWSDILQGVQAATPELRDLDVTMAGRISHSQALKRFGYHRRTASQDKTRAADEARSVSGSDEEEAGPSNDVSIWKLRGKLAVNFQAEQRRYVQRGDRVVRLRLSLTPS